MSPVHDVDYIQPPGGARTPRQTAETNTALNNDDSLDRPALTDAGLDPDDPQVWVEQRRVQLLFVRDGRGTCVLIASGARDKISDGFQPGCGR